jgi:hypothetical protein
MVVREVLADGGYGEETTTAVTVVITDIDDELPVFSRDKVAVPVPEDIGKLRRVRSAQQEKAEFIN